MNKQTWQKIAGLVAGCALVVVGTDAITYAGTGNSLILGKINKSGGTTTVVNTGRGPVLSLDGGKLYPPLKVNSKKKVANLNADLIDGLHASQLQPPTGRLGITSADLTTSETRYYKLKIPAGWYHFTLAGLLTSGTNTDSFTCIVGDLGKILAGNVAAGYYTYDTGKFDGPRGGVVNHSAIMHVAAGSTLVYFCAVSGTGPATQVQPITISYRSVPAPTLKVGTQFTPSPRAAQRLTAR